MDNNATGNAGTTGTDTGTYTPDMGDDYGAVQDAMLGKNMDDMYGQLDMTEDQIDQYRTASNKRMDAMKNNGSDRSGLDRNTLIRNQDADMKQLLSTEQYTRYRSLIQDYYPPVNGKGPGGTIDNNR
jgi:hypothetical protein